MSNDQDIQRKMTEIGGRYLARTVNELDDLKNLVTRFSAGDRATLKEIEVLAHRIRGSGAVFGFAAISDAAGVIEMLAVENMQNEPRTDLTEQFAAHLQQLSAEVRTATAQKAGA